MHRRPLAQWIAAAFAMSAMHAHAGGPPLSQSWLASQRQGATGANQQATPGSAGVPGLSPQTAAQLQQQQSVQQALQNLNRAAQAVAAQISAQQAAQQAAAAQAGSPVPDGIAAGGLQVAAGIASNPTLWQNANAPTQSVNNGQTNVEVKQTAQKAILTWDSFNVGRHTTLHFDQTGGTQTDGSNNWIALNRINDPSGRPSQILGQIKAEGSVYLINRNGILFGAGSQVNTHSLLATSMDLFTSDVNRSNAFFLQYGIAQTTDVSNILGLGNQVNAFLVNGAGTDSTGKATTSGGITIEKGASIQVQPNGYALIAAPTIRQSGSINADQGTAILASAPGLGYVSAANNNGSFSVGLSSGAGVQQWLGSIENDGLIEARQGNIQWLGSSLLQNGVLVASTSINRPGTIALDGQLIGTTASTVELGVGSVTTILPEKDGQTTSSSPAADQAFQTSSISITANDSIILDQNALIEAPSGNVTLSALLSSNSVSDASRIYLDHGAIIDVSGLADVELPMSALLVSIDRIGQNELADSPLLRNSFLYTQKNVVVDSSQSGVRADGLDWVGSPVLNVAGYVQNVPRSIDQLMLKGGTITLTADQTITRTGSQLRLDGGYLNYLPGWIQTPNLLGADGRIYNIADADPNMSYVGFAGQYADNHERWGVSDTYTNPLLSGMVRYDNGFIQGADAGSLNIGGAAVLGIAVLDGDVSAQAYRGRNQVSQAAAPLGGTLSITSGDIAHNIRTSIEVNYELDGSVAPLETINPLFDADSSLGGDPQSPGDPSQNWYLLPADMLGHSGISKFNLSLSNGNFKDEANEFAITPGGEVDVTAKGIQVDGTIRASSGKINLTAFGSQSDTDAGIHVGAEGQLDTRGLWINDSGKSVDDEAGSQYIDGGSISLAVWQSQGGTSSIELDKGSVLDVSSGGYVQQNGLVAVANDVPLGHGGDISIGTYVLPPNGSGFDISVPQQLGNGSLVLNGSLLGYGFSGGGTLSLQALKIQVGGDPSDDASVLYLPESFFVGQGFYQYNLSSVTDADIAAGTQVLVKPANLLPDYTALAAAPTGSNIYAGGLTQVGYLDDYHRWLLGAGSGSAAGLSISAGDYLTWGSFGPLASYSGYQGSLELGQGASIQVDAGATVDLQAKNQVLLFGQVRAPGGVIDAYSGGARLGVAGSELWLGEQSVLDASGISLINPIAPVAGNGLESGFIPRTGTVLDGGQVNLSADQYLLARAGARVDVSGSSDIYDLPSAQQVLGAPVAGYTPTSVWSDAGQINLSAAGGMLFDASLDGHAGATQGLGGSLSISGLSLQSTLPQPVAIVLQQSGDLLPDELQAGQIVEPGLTKPSGLLRFSIDNLKGTGIDNLQIGPQVGDQLASGIALPVLFAGNVNINLGRSVVINTPELAAVSANTTSLPVSGGSSAQAGQVSISAPYVQLANTLSTTNTPVSIAGDGTLTVQANFIDIGGRISLAGFDDANFNSAGDLRFYLPAQYAYRNGAAQTGWLFSTGDLGFSATRVYPDTNYQFLIDAVPQSAGQETTVSFSGNGNTDTSTPLSAGGGLTVAATHIDQGGTLWVPSGGIVLGVGDVSDTQTTLGLASNFALAPTQSVQLDPGSVTSVSLGDAIIPYGTTVDGKEWRYDGDPRQASGDITAPPSKQIVIQGEDVSLQQGATVDLSGGGDLQAYEWVAGTGGSRDVLAQSQISYAQSSTGQSQPQYPDNRPIYAVLPGYNAPVGAHDAALENGAGTGPSVGQAVYLSGVPGLPPGIYTLLPARYATLPGAFRVVQNTGSQDTVLGRNTTLPDGTQVVSGYFVDALTGARSARTTSFDVQSSSVWQQYSQYTLTSADSFFGNLASHAGQAAPSLPQDAGRLVLQAGDQLNLGVTLTGKVGDGGRGAEVDITGQAIEILGAGGAARDGYLAIDADGLSTLGASSLLIGGTRSDGTDGEIINVQAQSVLVSNDASDPLSAPEIILVTNGAGDGIDLAAGSVIHGSGSSTGLNGTPLVIGQLAADGQSAVSGDGALLQVSSGPAGSIVRRNVTGVDGPSGTAKGAINIDQSASVIGDNALTIDATGNTHIDAQAVLGAKDIDVTANRIAFVGNDTTAQDTSGMLIGSATLSQFDKAQSIALRSRGSIDFLGNVDVDLSHDLTLDAASVTSDGGSVDIAADKLTLTNDTGRSASFAAGTGQLAIHAGEWDLGDGNWTLQGFGHVDVTATQGVQALGTGTFDFGSLDVAVHTPSMVAGTGASVSLKTSADLSIDGASGAAPLASGQGGKISLSGGTVELDTLLSAQAGKLSITASNGDLSIGDDATLDVSGVAKTFNDVQQYASAGDIVLTASNDVTVAGSAVVNFAGAASGGSAGQLIVQAGQQADLQGQLLGSAAKGYLGGNLLLDAGGAVDLNAIADRATAGGLTGSIIVDSGAGNLDLAAGKTLTAHQVILTADGDPAGGGWVHIDGTVDASGDFGGSIELYGKAGVDVEGSLLSSASGAGQKGGNISIGTSGTSDGNLDPTYGYEEVTSAGSGSIIIGKGAQLRLSGAGGNGSLSLRAPLLVGGDVNVDIAPGARIVDADDVTLEAYATWSTADHPANPAQQFDGLIDPAGWYQSAPGTGVPQLVPGHFVDAGGTTQPDPDPTNAQQMADYMAKYTFVPDAANATHQSFYGYVDGDSANGPGTLMGFVQNPGISAASRFSSIANFHIRPGIDLVNPDTSINDGNISVLSNWNLGAGTRNSDGSLALDYRYGDQAPVLSLRAFNNLDIRASITDGFFQDSNLLGSGTVPEDTYEHALSEWQDLQNELFNEFGLTVDDLPGIFFAPTEMTGVTSQASGEYYAQYVAYASYLDTPDTTPNGPLSSLAPLGPAAFFGFGILSGTDGPTAPTLPTVLNDYPNYLTSYKPYLLASAVAGGFPGAITDNFQVLAPPPTTGDLITPPPPPLDNSPSPEQATGNPLPLLSATLAGGNSSSYRLVAGANVTSSNPLAVQALNLVQSGGLTGQINLDGHTDYTDTNTQRVVYAPTLIRTGDGSIDMAAAGDIRWLDQTAPAAIYTAGVPLAGSETPSSIAFLPGASGYAELIAANTVTPVSGGDISLHAGGDIVGIQQPIDTDGSATGVAGTSLAQYWWQWMQTNNSADGSRSSINFSAFDQGVMSAGGNIDVAAGGDIRQLSVSLPTTWYLSGPANAQTVNTVGGGNLSVRAGGDILSGAYFVAHGTGSIEAGGRIGSDFSFSSQVVGDQGSVAQGSTPVSILLALQDAQLNVQSGGDLDIGGIYDPSTIVNLVPGQFPAGHADSQNFSAASSVSVLSTSGDISYGTLANSSSLFVPAVASGDPTGKANFVLPATVSMTALNGNLDLLTGGELFPSPTGNLSLLASGNVQFDYIVDAAGFGNRHYAWGLIDAPASLLPSPLSPDTSAVASVLGQGDYLTNFGAAAEALVHQQQPLHGDDDQPVRIYALDGNIVNGTGGGVGGMYIVPNKPARIQAGGDIVDLAFIGQQTHASDITSIIAGHDIYDTSLSLLNAFTRDTNVNAVTPVLLLGGPGYFQVQAGRDIGPLTSQVDLSALQPPFSGSSPSLHKILIGNDTQTGIETVGNAFNPYLPTQGAAAQILYGVAPGMDQAAFIAKYIDPSTTETDVPSLAPDLVAFMDSYVAGLAVDTGLVKDVPVINLSADQAWAQFQALPANVQGIFVQKALFKILATVGSDYNDPSSPFHGQYARGYTALSTLFPASLGYTDNGSGQGGINGAQQTIDTGDLDIRNTTIQTQQGGDVNILAPGGQALLGSSSAPPVIVNGQGQIVAGPNTMGVLTLREGDINIFTDRSVQLAQSRIFTEQGGDIVAWSSNGDINAGKGAKTTTEIPPLSFLCDLDAYCLINPSGEVSGAGIATLQTIAGAASGNAYLMAPRGTVDAGDAGIRVSGNLVIAAAQVANADNIQVQGEKIGVPIAQSVNIGALNAASAAAGAVSHVAEDMANRQRDDARSQQPSVISVHVLGYGAQDNNGAQVSPNTGYDSDSPVQILGAGHLATAKRKLLTASEQQHLSQ
jgi:filamentous hemagglutinin family protein